MLAYSMITILLSDLSHSEFMAVDALHFLVGGTIKPSLVKESMEPWSQPIS